MLTDKKLKSLKPEDKLYKVADRDGLYVAVTKLALYHLDMITALTGVEKP